MRRATDKPLQWLKNTICLILNNNPQFEIKMLSQLFQWNWWTCGRPTHFIRSLRVPPCGRTSGCPLPTRCNKCLLCVNQSTCILQLIWLIIRLLVFYLPSFKKINSGFPSAGQRSLRASAPTGVVSMFGLAGEGAPHCLLLSRIALQSSDQDRRRLWEGLEERCLLWQAVNRMCSQVGLGSTPDWETFKAQAFCK